MLFGHQEISDHIFSLIEAGRFSHGSLIAGPDQIGKITLLLSLFQRIHCEGGASDSLFAASNTDTSTACGSCPSCKQIISGAFPDLLIIKTLEEKSTISVTQMREFLKQAYRAPVTGKYKFLIIEDAQLMTREASNALLKTLEEPPKSCLIFLTTSQPELLLPTIQSRCQIFDLPRVLEAPSDTNPALWLRSSGLPGKYLNYQSDDDSLSLEKQEVQAFLDFIESSKGLRLKVIETWFKKKTKTKNKTAEQKAEWQSRLNIWQNTLRDLLMLQLGNKELVRYPEVLQFPATNSVSEKDIQRTLDQLIDLSESLGRSYNLRLSLEHFALSF
jgi:DNA polymerase III delta prime subunit